MTKRKGASAKMPAARTPAPSSRPSPAAAAEVRRIPPISPPRRHPRLLVASAVLLLAWLIFLAWLALAS